MKCTIQLDVILQFMVINMTSLDFGKDCHELTKSILVTSKQRLRLQNLK